jgi:hypothetical protein
VSTPIVIVGLDAGADDPLTEEGRAVADGAEDVGAEDFDELLQLAPAITNAAATTSRRAHFWTIDVRSPQTSCRPCPNGDGRAGPR